MEIMKEEKLAETKLTESKEKLPISFLTDFVSRGWDDVGYLKETIKSISESFTGSNIKIKMLQHRLILQIAKGYILKGNAALNLTCSNRIRRIVNLHLMLHHLIEAIVTGHTALVHFRKHQQTENRLHKDVDI